jgi:hypothetical protein
VFGGAACGEGALPSDLQNDDVEQGLSLPLPVSIRIRLIEGYKDHVQIPEADWSSKNWPSASRTALRVSSSRSSSSFTPNTPMNK